jgi:hypothetical protein
MRKDGVKGIMNTMPELVLFGTDETWLQAPEFQLRVVISSEGKVPGASIRNAHAE